jgi:hypothetical protein
MSYLRKLQRVSVVTYRGEWLINGKPLGADPKVFDVAGIMVSNRSAALEFLKQRLCAEGLCVMIRSAVPLVWEGEWIIDGKKLEDYNFWNRLFAVTGIPVPPFQTRDTMLAWVKSRLGDYYDTLPYDEATIKVLREFKVPQSIIEANNMWKTKEGQLIPVSKLGNGHLVNILYMLRGKSHSLKEALINEAAKRGLPWGDVYVTGDGWKIVVTRDPSLGEKVSKLL